MNLHQAVLSVIGLLISSALLASETPRKSVQAHPSPDASTASPLSVWNSDAGDAEPPISAKLLRFAQRVVKKYDRDRNGTLQPNEWPTGHGDLASIDANHDGAVTAEELADYLARYARSHPLHKPDTAWQHMPQPPAEIFQPVTPSDEARKGGPAAGPNGAPPNDQAKPSAGGPSPEGTSPENKKPPKSSRTAQQPRDQKYYVSPSSLPPGLPGWFHDLDTDGDGQLTLGEFAPDGSSARRHLFQRYDQNGDGVITPDEVLRLGKGATETKNSSTTANAGAANASGGAAK
jgi:hypothetical protein